MAVSNLDVRNAFDFSRDAGDFKNMLWKQLQEVMGSASPQPLEDDDLEILSAAGVPHLPPEDDEPV